jgi:hypothetical protein
VNTGARGVGTLRFESAAVGGRVIVRGVSENAVDAVDTISVGVGGLVALAESAHDSLIGYRDEHPDNHWCAPAMVAALGALADSFYARYSKRLGYNDMSLQLGGVFDLSQDWKPPHDEHRTGTDVDLRTQDRTPAELRFLEERWRRLSGAPADLAVNEESDPPHYHLRF